MVVALQSESSRLKARPTQTERGRSNRIAPLYGLMEDPIERSRSREWRKLPWSKAEGSHILEGCVGVGRDFPYYRAGAGITAIDTPGTKPLFPASIL